VEKKKLTLILGQGPYQSDRAYTTLGFVVTALVAGMEVNLFLTENNVFLGKEGQNPVDFANAQEWLERAIGEGARIKACEICSEERGMISEDFIEGVELTLRTTCGLD
jgi:sulfur relay (sulfurtransferase) complex TusBCD TusD component (DsrE family)